VTAPAPDDTPFSSRLRAFIVTYHEVVEAINEDPDRQQACLDATKLTTALRGQYEDASHQRAIIATEVVDSSNMKLSGLARLLGISKQRANQIVKIGRSLI